MVIRASCPCGCGLKTHPLKFALKRGLQPDTVLDELKRQIEEQFQSECPKYKEMKTPVEFWITKD